MANSTTVTTVTWYLTVPDLRPTLLALSIRARCAVGGQFSLKATYCKFSASSGKNCSWQSHPSTRTHAWCGGCASKNALSTTHAWKASSLLWIKTKCTRTVKGLDLSKGPKLQPHSISCWRLEDCNRGKKRAACVMQVRQDFAIMRFCTPRFVCQGPYCT